MRRSALFYTLTGVLCLILPGSSQAETLREAVTAALVSHPAIDIAKAQREVADEEESEEFSNLFPELGATATGGRVFGNNATSRGLSVSRGEAYSWLWEGTASITQPIFNGFETYNRIDAAQAREASADLTLADARQGVALRAAQAFLNVTRAQKAYAKAESYKDKIKDYVGRINGMVEAGAADEAESAQAKNIQAQLENTVAEMEGALKLALADYVEATGSMPAGELRGGEQVKSLLFGNVDEAVTYAQTKHPLVLSAQKAIEAEENEVSAEKGVLMPDLDGEVSTLKRDQKEEIGGEVVDSRAIMRMSWGFSTGGGQLARIRKAKAERSEALARLAQTQREIERDIRRSFAEYETAKKQKDLNAQRAVVTKDLLATYEKQFEASKVRILQLLQAENQLFTTELEQINSDARLSMAEYTTLASSGRLLEALSIDPSGLPDKQEPASGDTVAPVAAPVPQTPAAAEPATVAAPAQAVKPAMMQPILSPEDYRDDKKATPPTAGE
jgi:adhesin transport system outer membrane protein